METSLIGYVSVLLDALNWRVQATVSGLFTLSSVQESVRGAFEASTARYTFITGVSCSNELCGRMALLFECSFSRFCKKLLLLRPSRMTVLLEARLTRVLWGGGGIRLIYFINMPFELGDVFMHPICPRTFQGRRAQRVQCQKNTFFLPL